MKKHLFFIIFICFFLFTCKKYEDGPLISFKKAETRITGEWDIYKFYVNGNDSSYIFKNKYYFWILACDYTGGDCESRWNVFSYISDTLNLNSQLGYEGFSKDKKSFQVNYRFNYPDSDTIKIIGPFTSGIKSNWIIKKLRMNDVWLKCDYIGDEYFVKLIRK